MKLAVPTDFEILEALADGKRNTAANLSYILDKDRSYINTRLPVLADYELVERIGPAPNSGLYEITEKGIAAVDLQEEYRSEDVDFEAALEAEVENAAV
jgi:predicted transcriptional regulator